MKQNFDLEGLRDYLRSQPCPSEGQLDEATRGLRRGGRVAATLAASVAVVVTVAVAGRLALRPSPAEPAVVAGPLVCDALPSLADVAAVADSMRRPQPSPRPAAKPTAAAKPAVAPSVEATLVAEDPAAPADDVAPSHQWFYDDEAELLQYGEMICSNSDLDGYCDDRITRVVNTVFLET